MPLREDLLTPVAGQNPAGPSLRYDRVFDQIKEARTEEDDTLPSGAWARQAKRADYRVAAKLAGDALATRSKDLQLAVWLGEALLRQEGVSVLAPVLRLTLDLQQTFWETLHPEIDEGDASLRAVPLQWAAKRYATLVNEAGLTRKGISIFEYKAARAIGTEEEASNSDAKREQREQAIAAGKFTAEDLDDAIAKTPKSFYVELDQSFTDTLDTLAELEPFCDERYGEDSPSFRGLRQNIEEVQNLVASLLREKRLLDPDPVADAGPGQQAASSVEAMETFAADALTASSAASVEPRELQRDAARESESSESIASAAESRPRSTGSRPEIPESWEDALARVESAVAYMDALRPESTLPFLVRSSMRLAELHDLADTVGIDVLAAPTTELRQLLKRAAGEQDWITVHREAFAALGQPCGRAWLDLYRYLWNSARELGWALQQTAIAGAVQQRLHDVAGLPRLTLNDDTPVANADTLRWLNEEIAPPPPSDQSEAAPTLEAVLAVERERMELQRSETNTHADVEDLFITARGLLAHGQIQGAIQLLARDAAQQSVGRLRFGRNLQIAELCLESGNSAVAVPVLQGLIREVEERKLESWEPRDTAARPYALLLQCAAVAKLDAQSIFARLCAIDPSAALTMAPPVEG